MTEVSYPLAFLAGVLSFLSPCVLPLVPSYVTYITGMSFEEITAAVDKKRVRYLTITNSLAFVLGFSVVFIALGASTSYIGHLFRQYQDTIRIAGGVLIIIFGLFISGILKLDFMMKDAKFHLRGKPAGYAGTFLVGIVFAAGWTPCIGPILGGILLYASSSGSTIFGVKLLAFYSLGLAIPFLLSALAFNTFLSYTKGVLKHMKLIMAISGIVLIIFGVLLLTDRVSQLSTWFPDLGLDI